MKIEISRSHKRREDYDVVKT